MSRFGPFSGFMKATKVSRHDAREDAGLRTVMSLSQFNWTPTQSEKKARTLRPGAARYTAVTNKETRRVRRACDARRHVNVDSNVVAYTRLKHEACHPSTEDILAHSMS